MSRSRASSYATLTNNNSPNESDPAWKSRGSSPTSNEVQAHFPFSQFTGIENEKPPQPFWLPVNARSKMAPVANPYIQLINYRNNEAERLLGASNKGKYKTFKKRKNRKNRKSRKSRI